MRYSRSNFFARFAGTIATAVGHPIAFMLAVGMIVAWLITGPAAGYSDTWQLVINTATTVITFLVVVLIQNTQNRDAHTMQLKLDELIRAVEGAHNALLDLEELSDHEIGEIRKRYCALARDARDEMRRGGSDTGTPEVGLTGGQPDSHSSRGVNHRGNSKRGRSSSRRG